LQNKIGNISAERITREKNNHNIGYFKTESNVPVLGLCEACNTQFSAELKPGASADKNAMWRKFNAHACKADDGSKPQKANVQ
jgi:hypothetical protein